MRCASPICHRARCSRRPRRGARRCIRASSSAAVVCAVHLIKSWTRPSSTPPPRRWHGVRSTTGSDGRSRSSPATASARPRRCSGRTCACSRRGACAKMDRGRRARARQGARDLRLALDARTHARAAAAFVAERRGGDIRGLSIGPAPIRVGEDGQRARRRLDRIPTPRRHRTTTPRRQCPPTPCVSANATVCTEVAQEGCNRSSRTSIPPKAGRRRASRPSRRPRPRPWWWARRATRAARA